jgi:hypothetical protein
MSVGNWPRAGFAQSRFFSLATDGFALDSCRSTEARSLTQINGEFPLYSGQSGGKILAWRKIPASTRIGRSVQSRLVADSRSM